MTISPPSQSTGDMLMLVTSRQRPLVYIYMMLAKAQDPADPVCSGPVRASLRWTTLPYAMVSNTLFGLFPDEDALGKLPRNLVDQLDTEQRQTLLGISASLTCVQVVDAVAGAGKSHVAKRIIWRYCQTIQEPELHAPHARAPPRVL